MFMPVEEDEKTEGHTESKRKKTRESFFMMGRTAFTEVESEKMLKLLKRYCEEKEKWK